MAQFTTINNWYSEPSRYRKYRVMHYPVPGTFPYSKQCSARTAVQALVLLLYRTTHTDGYIRHNKAKVIDKGEH